jgi:hypothetical protein
MEQRDAVKLVAELRAEQVADQKRIDARQMVIDGMLALYPDQPESRQERPKTQDAIRQIMQESPGKWFTVTLMVHELETRGWSPDSDNPASAVRTAMARLAESEPRIGKGQGEKTGSVTYSFRSRLETSIPEHRAILTGETRNGSEVHEEAMS